MENTLRNLQITEYKMLKDIASFCDANDIQYYIIDGTLLGAIRHGGFIPWDDDIDIGMDLRNYKKFLKLSKNKLSDKYFVQNISSDPQIWHPWTQIRMNNTTSMDPRFKKSEVHSGICMDIFLFNGISNNKLYEKIQRKLSAIQRRLLKKYYYIDGDIENKNSKIVTVMPEHLRRTIIIIIDRVINIDIRKTHYCYSTFFVDVGKQYKYESKWFLDLQKIKFEDDEFFAPKEAEKYLKTRYGNWKELPPESERTGHGDIIIDLNRNYTFYQSDE